MSQESESLLTLWEDGQKWCGQVSLLMEYLLDEHDSSILSVTLDYQIFLVLGYI